MQPYGIVSDTHNHNWSAFSTVLPTGINSRLQITLDETDRAGDAVLAAGGKTLIHGGDLFHVRGNLAPSVLNPTRDCYRRQIEKGLDVILNAGNHDLEGKEAEEVSSAITAMKDVGCTVINRPQIHRVGAGADLAIIPWIPNIANLKAAIEGVVDDASFRKYCDLFIHAPIDGVISGLPDHGLTAKVLAAYGFRRVFAGHYHHHKDCGQGVYSIGALTHQTWSDVSSKAGFMIVDEISAAFHESKAPQFLELDATSSQAQLGLLVKGNYVKARVGNLKNAQVEELRDFLVNQCGALGAVILCEKNAPTTARAGSTYKGGTTMEQSIGSFIDSKGDAFKRAADLKIRCNETLTRVRSAVTQ